MILDSTAMETAGPSYASSDFFGALFDDVSKTIIYTHKQCSHLPLALVKMYGNKSEYLNMSCNQMTRLDRLDEFVRLRDLILDDNQLSDEVKFPRVPTLQTLSLNKNQITDICTFVEKVKYSFPNLTFLSLLGNKACPNQLSDVTKDENDYKRYRFYVIHHLRKLKFLDSSAVSQAERREAVIRGAFMIVRRPKIFRDEDEISYIQVIPTNEPNLTGSSRQIGDRRSAYIKYKSRKNATESEGNRFIKNRDL